MIFNDDRTWCRVAPDRKKAPGDRSDVQTSLDRTQDLPVSELRETIALKESYGRRVRVVRGIANRVAALANFVEPKRAMVCENMVGALLNPGHEGEFAPGRFRIYGLITALLING